MVYKLFLWVNTISTFTSPDISQEGQEIKSNNDGTNGSVIRNSDENILKDSMTTNATTKDMKDITTNGHTTTSTTEPVETVGVQSTALGKN
jgi:hypothetical protein